MTHALLDGLHRRFEEASNPDVPAFHEAFADIVALFQHFTITELVRFEIARSRGDLSAATLLAGLARQFGEGAAAPDRLRNYIDACHRGAQISRHNGTARRADRSWSLPSTKHSQRIVAYRTDDLLRIATGGTGILPAGALHPDLVNRLTQETCETAAARSPDVHPRA